MKYQVIVKGKHHSWCLDFYNPEQARDMRADGFEVDEIVNTIPAWVVDLRLTRAWCAAQDVLYWPVRMWDRLTKR